MSNRNAMQGAWCLNQTADTNLTGQHDMQKPDLADKGKVHAKQLTVSAGTSRKGKTYSEHCDPGKEHTSNTVTRKATKDRRADQHQPAWTRKQSPRPPKQGPCSSLKDSTKLRREVPKKKNGHADIEARLCKESLHGRGSCGKGKQGNPSQKSTACRPSHKPKLQDSPPQRLLVHKDSQAEHPVFGKMIARAKAHVARIRREMNVLDVYQAEGWRGANRDKLKPRAEMQRAEQQVSKSKTALRDMLRICEEGEGRPIPQEKYDDNGELDQEHIFCAICDKAESYDDNDIVLCDGPCQRAFHEECCTPRFCAAELEEDSDWLCPACIAKDEILDMISENFEIRYELDTPAASVFQMGVDLVNMKSVDAAPLREAGANASTWATLLGSDELVSSDTDDASFRVSTDTGDNHSQSSVSNSSAGSSENESSSALSSPGGATYDMSSWANLDGNAIASDSDALEILDTKRVRRKIDYVTLNQEMFNDEADLDEDSSDGEWN